MKPPKSLKIACLLGAAMLQAVIGGAQPVTEIAGGWGHSLFLKSDGSLWAMGDNNYGDLGDGTYNETNYPELVVASNVVAIATHEYHNLFLKSDGSLWAVGYNVSGQLGDGVYSSGWPYSINETHTDCS